MTATNFDIATYRPEAPYAGGGAPARNERAGDNAFADILRAQNAEREMPADDRVEDRAPHDERAAAPAEKPVAREIAKDKDVGAKPQPARDTQATDDSAPKADAPTHDTKPRTDQAARGESDASPTPMPESKTTTTQETPSPDVAAIPVVVNVVVPVAPVPVATTTTEVTSEAAIVPAAPKAAPVPPAPTPAQTPDPSQIANAKPAETSGPDARATTANAAQAAIENANYAATPIFDQLVAAATGLNKPRNPATPAKTSEPPAVAAPAKPAVSAASAAANVQQPAAAPTANAVQNAAPVAAAPSAAADKLELDVPADSDDTAALAALVTRPAPARSADARPAPTLPGDVTVSVEPTLRDAAPVDAPAPRNNAGALTAATGLAAQVKAQELQNAPQAAADSIVTPNADKLPVEANGAKAAAPETAAKSENETPASAASRSADAPATAPAHDSSVRGTSFADSLSAARGSRASANPLVAQIAVHVAKAVSDGNDRITIKLSPADLGRIDVRLDIGNDGRIQAVFAADKPQTVEMLQRDARELERALQDAGLRADSGSLSFNLRGEHQHDNAPGFGAGSAHERGDEVPHELPAASATQIYSASNAGNGRLDIHV